MEIEDGLINELHSLLFHRNHRETIPFVPIHEANATLLNQIDALQAKCESLQRELSAQQQLLDEVTTTTGKNNTTAAALKNEARLRDKLESLQEELNTKLKLHAEEQASALKTAKELSELKDVNTAQEVTIANLKKENERQERAIEHLTNELTDSKARTKLAEQQYMGLKETIRSLQEENDVIKKENRQLESRILNSKSEMSEEVNILTEMVDSLKREVDMLRSLKAQEEKRKRWFGKSATTTPTANEEHKTEQGASHGRKFGTTGVVVPSGPKHIVHAHSQAGTCVRYDATGTNLVATASSDSTVKVWDTSTGTVRATLRGGTGHTILGCDIGNGLVVGASSDKTCRVWNLRTERMVHHLVGHGHKVTCVRLFSGDRAVLTASADRCLKVWDISRKTYRHTVNLRHSSTANAVDVGVDAFTAVSGHLDGGLRFWDLRTGDRTADISDIHTAAITSVQFDPTCSTQVLTNSMDGSLKLVDIRTCTAVHTLTRQGFQTSHGWSSSAISPNGAYAAAGSSSNGDIYIWSLQDGSFVKKLSGHKTGVCGFDWGRGGSNAQQVASIDRDGVLILWA